MALHKDTSNLYLFGALVVMLLSVVLALHLQGREWWCPAGDLVPWSWRVWSQHNSQHLVDAYSFTHLLHGILEFWILSVIFPKSSWRSRLLAALLVESSWEIVENTDYVINRYRDATISLNYFGDSVFNSLADVAFCGAGFGLAYVLRFWRSAALFLFTEAVLLFTIHDSLVLNIVMLVYPIDEIRAWQTGK